MSWGLRRRRLQRLKPGWPRLITGWPVLAALSVALLSSGHASPYLELSLRIIQTNFHYAKMLGNGTSNAAPQERVRQWSARCTVGGSDWLIQSAAVPNAVSTYFFDGTNVLQTTKITAKPKFSSELTNGVALGYISPIAWQPSESDWIYLGICPGCIPLEDIGAQLPWLALCSGTYLRRPGRVLPLPGVVTRICPGAFAFKDRTECFTDQLGLPRAVDFFASSELLPKSVKHESLFRLGKSTAAIRNAVRPRLGLPEGFLEARYRVLAHTNVAGCIIPTSFVYEEFRPAAGGGAAPALVVAGLVSSIEESSAPTFALSPTARYSVSDYRFRHPTKVVDQIHYAITNGKIPPTTDAALRRLFDKQVGTAAIDPVVKAHFGIYVVFTALLAGPVIAMAVARLRRNWKMSRGEI